MIPTARRNSWTMFLIASWLALAAGLSCNRPSNRRPAVAEQQQGLVCDVGECIYAPDLCGNDLPGGDPYTDTGQVPCGGGPPHCACEDGRHCLVARDCISAVCSGGVCQEPTCNDGVKNSDESNVDCGGTSCPPCATGSECADGLDCLTGVCGGGSFCVPPRCLPTSCGDGVWNGDESDVDCGGSCAGCDIGETCDTSSDCLSTVCDEVCRITTCGDGVKDASETDVDCGGPDCRSCDDGQACGQDADCQSEHCAGGICQPANCDVNCESPPCGSCGSHCVNGVLDGDETDVDCGGSCQPCRSGRECSIDGDCLSDICSGNICQASCDDGDKNDSETDFDCGGSCPDKCSDDQACHSASDCESPRCDDNAYCGTHLGCFSEELEGEEDTCRAREEFVKGRLDNRKSSGPETIKAAMEADTKLVFLGEAHGSVSYSTYAKWLAELEKGGAAFNCIFLEIASIPEYQKVLDDFHRNTAWKDSIGKVPALRAVAPEEFAETAKKNTIRFIAVDLYFKPKTIEDVFKATELRNQTMANNIRAALQPMGCGKALMIVGQGHIDSNLWSEKTKSLPQFLTDAGVTKFKAVLIQPHRAAFNPGEPDPRLGKLEYGSTFQSPDPCKYSFKDDKLTDEWGFTVSSSLTRVDVLSQPGGKRKSSPWSLWNGYVKTAR